MSLQNTAVSRLRTDSQVKQTDLVPALVRVNEQRSLRECVKEAVHTYFHHLDGQDVTEVYEMVLAEIEAPLLEVVMQHVRGNQSRAATLLGLNRGTLRKKLKQYGLL